MRRSDASFDVLVIGAGIHGLCVAWQLKRRGVARVGVLDRFAAGHARGSSHGHSRITRSSYHDALYVRLAQAAHAEGWPALASDTGVVPIVRTPGVFFGPDGPRFRAFVDTTVAAGAEVEVIEARAAAQQFPLLAFGDARAVLLDHTAGVVRADVVCEGLRRWLAGHGVEVTESSLVAALHAESDHVAVDTDRGVVRADRVVVAAGAGVARLLPELGSRFTVLRQSVGYFSLRAAAEAVCAPRFPVWARVGADANDFVYGLPAVGRSEVKLARHVTEGPADDPDAEAALPAPAAAADLDACARAVFGDHLGSRAASETCLYTMTRDQHFVVDSLPQEPRIVVCSACSGHGFKFGPVIGKLVAAILIDGAQPPPEFCLRPR